MDNFDSIKELFSKTISQANSQAMNPIEYGVAEKSVQRNTILFKALVRSVFLTLYTFILACVVYVICRIGYAVNGQDSGIFSLSIVTFLIFTVSIGIVVVILKLKYSNNKVQDYRLYLYGIVPVAVGIGVVVLAGFFHGNVSSDGTIIFEYSIFSFKKLFIIIVFGGICFGVIYIFNFFFYLKNMANLSFAYYYDGNNKVYIYHREGNRLVCGKKDYIMSNNKCKKEFETEIKKQRAKIEEKEFSGKNKENLKIYMDKVYSYSGYIKLEEEIVQSFLEELGKYCNNSNFSDDEFLRYLDDMIKNKFEPILPLFYVNETDAKFFLPVCKMEQEFYFRDTLL